MKRNWRLIGSTGVLLFSKSITTLAHKPCSDICPQLTAFRCPSNLYEHCPAFELPVGDDGALRVRGGGAGEDAAESDDRTSPESVTANESIPSPGVCDKEVEADRKQRTNGENEVQEKKGSYSLTGISRDIHDASDAEANDSTSVSPETSIIEDDDAAEPSTLSKPLNDFASSDPEQGENTLNETNLEVPEANASFWDSSSNSLHRFDLLSHKILQLLERHYDNPGSDPTKGNGLRDLVLERCEEYIDELRLRHEKNLKKDKKKRPHHPEKVLHFLAPKIPAIKQSPDFTLRIKSAKAELDGSIAAYMIGSIACLVEMHELVLSESIGTGADDPNNANEERPDGTSAKSLLSDRRLEQLVECVLCGIDTEGDMRELEEFEQATSSSDSGVSDPGGKIATRSTTKGLSVMDASFAAFGLSLLDIEEGQLLSGLSPGEILSSLSLHCRARLLATEQHLRRDKSAAQADLDSIAHDTATALWAFACVKSNTGEYSDSLFDAGASILVFDESALLESKQEEVAMEDIVDRLAAASEDTVGFSSPDHIIAESDDATASIPRTTVDSETSVLRDKNKFADEMKNGSTLLLDRLSQTQAINTLWALAIHGSNDNQALHRKSDSDSSSNFSSVESENFVDLLLGRVATILQAEKDRLMDTPTVINQISGRDDENVIDTSEGQTASAEDWSGSDTQNGDVHMGAKTASESETLLKEHSGIDVEGEAVTSEVREDIRDTEVETNQDGAKVVDGSIDDAGETIQVMSAAAILEAEARQMEKNHRESDELVKISQDSADHDISLVETMNATAMVQTEMEQNSEDHSEVILDKVALIHENCERVDNGDEAPSSVLSLSAKDLCSIAWSATELNRPSSSDIIANAIIILQSFSEEAFLVMDGSALSNIAWAIAKSSEASQGNIVDTSLIYNIADIALKQLRARQDTFQPPELSRLLWSIAVIESSSRGILSGISYRNHTFSKLAILALSIADANLPIFSVEDLSRIVWSFAELTDTSQDMDILPGTSAESFGRIHETIEVSLMRWETGQKNAAHSVHNKDEKNFFSRFPTTFFGKARSTRLPLLDIRIPEVDEYDDDNQYRETLQLPALKDLTVDPSTLCKVAFGSSLISRNHQYIVGSEQILRIATRLFASKDGRLLSECNPADVVRMCCACVDTMKLAGKEIRGSDREYVLRQFPRRVVQLINAPACRNITSSASNGAHTSYLDQLTPSELSAMLFSLGELGVKLGTGMEPPQAEYRKLRVVPACPCLSTEQLESLTASSAVNLLCGLVSIGGASRQTTALLSSLKSLQDRVDELKPHNICRLIASLSNVQRRINPKAAAKSSSTRESSPKAPTKPMDANEGRVVEKGDEEDGNFDSTELDMPDGVEKVIDNLASPKGNNAEEVESVLQESKYLMQLVLGEAAENISAFSGEQLRRILLHINILTFEAEAFVDAAEREVKDRLSAFESDESTSGIETFQDLSQYAADAAVDIATTLSTSSLADGPFQMLRKGGKNKGLASAKLSDLAAEANRAAAHACEAAARLERVSRGAHINGEELLQQVEQGAVYELGRCQALIDRYRRVKFSDEGPYRRSRHDEGRRRLIGKHVASRLFQG